MTIRVAILGDRNPDNPRHLATEAALDHAARSLGVTVDAVWFGTDALLNRATHDRFLGVSGVFCTSGSPYRSFEGALLGIQSAREERIPFLGTCGGFQHTVIEIARNLLGITDARHGEYDGADEDELISLLACSLVGKAAGVQIKDGTRAASCYQSNCITERFFCSYGINPRWDQRLREQGLPIVGTDRDGTSRILEVTDHPFFLATLFVPQVRSTPENPHPLVVGLVQAAQAR